MPVARVSPAMVAAGRTIAEARLSPNGRHIAFVSAAHGVASLAVVPLARTGAPAGAEVAIAVDPAPAAPHPYGGGTFDWTPDGVALVYVSKSGALYVVGVDGGAPKLIAEPASGGRLGAPTVSPDGRFVAASFDGEQYGAVVFAPMDGSCPWPVAVTQLGDNAPAYGFDPAWSNGWLAWHEWDNGSMPFDASRIVARPFDPSTARFGGAPIVVAGGPDVGVAQPRWSPDGRLLGYMSDATGWRTLWVNPSLGRSDESGDQPGVAHQVVADEREHAGPTWGLGARTWAWAPSGRVVAFDRNEEGFGRLVAVSLVAPGQQPQARELSRGVHVALSWSPVPGTEPDAAIGTSGSEGRIGAIRTGARTPDQVVVIDVATGQRSQVALGPASVWDMASLPEPSVERWTAADGLQIPGRFYRPSYSGGPIADRPPLLVLIHGGPTSQSPVTFNRRISFWVDRGWAVLVPDHRGSSGWGRPFQSALDGHWGELDIEDTASGIRYCVQQGWCDARRVVAMGGSAGGFTVLGLLAREPELCAAGVDLFGVADLFDLDETTHRFEKTYLRTLVGELPESAARFRMRSPVELAERITAPLLILQGEDDKVVPPAQSKAIADRLRALGRTVELHLYPGEGHGWSRAATVADEFERTETFLRRHVLMRRA